MQTEDRLKQEAESGGPAPGRGPGGLGQASVFDVASSILKTIRKRGKKERKAWKSLIFVEGSLPQRPDCGLGRQRWFGSWAAETNQLFPDAWQRFISVYLLHKRVSRYCFRCRFPQTCSTQSVPLPAPSSPSEKSPYKVCPTGKYVCRKARPHHRTSYYQHSYLILIVFYLFNFFSRFKLALISHWADTNQSPTDGFTAPLKI